MNAYPGSRIVAEPSRAECEAADQQAADMLAASIATHAHALTDALGDLLDRRDDEWREEHHDALVEIRALLTKAHEKAEGMPA